MSRLEWIYTGQSTIKVKALPFAAAKALATPSESSVVPLHVTQLLMDLRELARATRALVLGSPEFAELVRIDSHPPTGSITIKNAKIGTKDLLIALAPTLFRKDLHPAGPKTISVGESCNTRLQTGLPPHSRPESPLLHSVTYAMDA